MRIVVLILALVMLARMARPATFYFDNAATAGSNNGTSWANAWTNNASVNWSSINPGDTIKISGGSTTKVYNENFIIQEDGTFGNRITIQNGQDSGHNGVADFGTNSINFADGTPRFITIDGARNPSFTAPTNSIQLTNGSTAISNNIGFHFRDKVGGLLASTSPNLWFLTEGVSDLTLKWFKVSGYTNTVSGGSTGFDPRGTVIYGDIDPPEACTNIVVEYFEFQNNAGQQVSWNGQNNDTNSPIEFRFFVMQDGGEDHFEVGSGFRIHDAIIGPARSGGGVHCDMIQLTGSYARFYNLLIGESYNAIMRIQSFPGATALSTGYVRNVWFYNNEVTEMPGRSLHGGTLVEPFCLVHFDSLHPAHMIIWDDIMFANNTFVNSLTNTTITPEMARNPLIYFSRGNQVTNAQFLNSKWVNNLVVNKHKGVSLPGWTNTAAQGAWPYTTNDFWADYNTQSSDTPYATLDTPHRFYYMDEDVLDGSSAYTFSNNTNRPVFVSLSGGNFELAASDTVAKNTGYNLSAYFTTDALNRPRNVGSAWDRGARELQETNLVRFYSFDADTNDGPALDSSGLGINAQRFVLNNNSWPTNRAASALAGSTLRPNVSGNALDFKWNTNNNATIGSYTPTYNDDGNFLAITNLTRLTNLSQFTISFWARYASGSRLTKLPVGYENDANATLISAGTATATIGSWDMQRFNQSIWINNTRFMIVTNSNASTPQSGDEADRAFGKAGRFVINFPDRGFDNDGDTTNWHHYAVTFNAGVVKSYFDGQPWTTNDISGVTNRLTVGRGSGRPYDWIAIGANTHVGTPDFDNESGIDYPNHGWMNGAIDNVRMYDRALADNEIIRDARLDGAEFAEIDSGGGGSSGTGATNNAARFFKLKGLRIR